MLTKKGLGLSNSHLRTYNTIFQHPVSHNLAWHDVYALFRQLGAVEEEHNGNIILTRHGKTLTLHPHHTKQVADTDQLMNLRRLLDQSEDEALHANSR